MSSGTNIYDFLQIYSVDEEKNDDIAIKFVSNLKYNKKNRKNEQYTYTGQGNCNILQKCNSKLHFL